MSAIHAARATEKILGLGATLALVNTQLGQLEAFAEELEPELAAVQVHLENALDALASAASVVDTRLQMEFGE